MGIKRFSPVALTIARSSGATTPVIISGSEGPSIMACDANSFVYWAYETFTQGSDVNTDSDLLTTQLDTGSIMRKIVDLFLQCLNNLVKAVKPEVLVIALDGVPPAAKIIDQRSRRIDAPPNDVYGPDGELRFTTSWICPNSPLMSLLDQSLVTCPSKGKIATIYSGPGTNGEGEHKLFPILQALYRHGLKSIPKNGHNPDWRPKTTYIIGNDNDLYPFSALFLASFEESVPKVFLYRDRDTRLEVSKTTASDGDSTSSGGILRITDATQLQLFDIQQFLNAIGNPDGPYGCCGTTVMQRLLHFVHLASLLGNDFVPQIDLGGDTDNTAMLKLICEASRNGQPHIPEIELPIHTEESEIPYAEIVSKRDELMRTLQRIHESIGQNPLNLCHGWTSDRPGINLRKLGRMNAVKEHNCNAIAIAASCDYVRLMDSIISYYVSSTCVVPTSIDARFTRTMPHEYYAYGTAPPAYNYLTVAAQILHLIQKDGAPEYRKVHAALENFSMSNIKHASPATATAFIEMGLHSAWIFPARTAKYVTEGTYPSAHLLAEGMSGVFPLKSDEDTNPNILPGVIFEYGCKAYADRSGGYARGNVRAGNVWDVTRQSVPESNGLRVKDSLA